MVSGLSVFWLYWNSFLILWSMLPTSGHLRGGTKHTCLAMHFPSESFNLFSNMGSLYFQRHLSMSNMESALYKFVNTCTYIHNGATLNLVKTMKKGQKKLQSKTTADSQRLFLPLTLIKFSTRMRGERVCDHLPSARWTASRNELFLGQFCLHY